MPWLLKGGPWCRASNGNARSRASGGEAVGGAPSVAFSDVLSAATIRGELSATFHDALMTAAASEAFSLTAISSKLSTAGGDRRRALGVVGQQWQSLCAGRSSRMAAGSTGTVGSITLLRRQILAEMLKKFFDFEKVSSRDSFLTSPSSYGVFFLLNPTSDTNVANIKGQRRDILSVTLL